MMVFTMTSPVQSSPVYKNLRRHSRQSPVEIQEKLRKTYKDRIRSCRSELLCGVRGIVDETNLRKSLTVLWTDMLTDDDEIKLFEDEYAILESVKEEIMQAELNWLLDEYEKSQLNDVDWSLLAQDNDVICPICQKVNLLFNSSITCPRCDYSICSQLGPQVLKNEIANCIELHSIGCNKQPVFNVIPDNFDKHIYLICDECSFLRLIF